MLPCVRSLDTVEAQVKTQRFWMNRAALVHTVLLFHFTLLNHHPIKTPYTVIRASELWNRTDQSLIPVPLQTQHLD
jgi:hypothetical protein